MRKLYSFLLTATLLFVSQTAWAYDFEVDGIYYDITSSSEPLTVEVTYKSSSYNSYSGEVVIPNSVVYGGKSYDVTSIGIRAFSGCTSLTSITLPEGLTSIGIRAFYGCTSLTSITLPEGLTSIGVSAFHNCPSLTSITLPEGLTSIGSYAFHNCPSLTSITLPESLSSIGERAFYDCTNLKFNQFENAEYLGSENNPYLYLIQANSTGVSSCTVNNRCKLIGYEAFEGCTSLTSITLPESLTSIGSYAFYGCTSLTSLTIPKGVSSIGVRAFYGCTGLTSITLPEGLTSFGEYAFYHCTSLTSITLPEGLTSIGKSAYLSCTSLTNISLPSTLNRLGDGALQNCSMLTSISCSATIPPACGTDVFKGVEATNCTLNVSEESMIYYRTFYGWNIFTNVVALEETPSGIESINANEHGAPIYDLNGRRQGASAKNGLFIQNGKKKLIH